LVIAYKQDEVIFPGLVFPVEKTALRELGFLNDIIFDSYADRVEEERGIDLT